MYILRVMALEEHANVGLNMVMRRIRQPHLTHVVHVFTAISQHEQIIDVSCCIYYRSFVSIISLCFFNSSAKACFSCEAYLERPSFKGWISIQEISANRHRDPPTAILHPGTSEAAASVSASVGPCF